MRNVVSSLVAYVIAVLMAFYCMITYTMGPRWYTALSLVFGCAVTYCLTDLIVRGIVAVIDAREEREEEADE